MFDSPDAPLVDLIWFFTELDFQKFPSSINSLDWDEAPWTPRRLGEVYGAKRSYNARLSITGLHGGHKCGEPEQFLNGSPWPPVGPERIYDADNIPECCDRTKPNRVSSAGRPASNSTYTPGSGPKFSSAGRPASNSTYTPGDPTPGPTCVTAATIILSKPYRYVLQPGAGNWFRLPPILVSEIFKLEVRPVTDEQVTVIWVIYKGSCPVLVTVAEQEVTAPNCYSIASTTAVAMWLRIENIRLVAVEMEFELAPGMCVI